MSQNQYQQNNYYTQSQLYSSNVSDSQSSSLSQLDLTYNNTNQFLDISDSINNQYRNSLTLKELQIQRNNQYKNSFHYSTMQDIYQGNKLQSMNQITNFPINGDSNQPLIENTVQSLNNNNNPIEDNSQKQSETQAIEQGLALIPQKERVKCGIINKVISKPLSKLQMNGKNSESSENESNEENSSCKILISSKSCSSNCLNSRVSFQRSNTNAKKKKKYQITSILKNVVVDNSFLIPGQIIINTQFDQGYRNVYINSNIYQSAKKVERVVYNKERETFESHFLTQFSGITDFEFVIKLLESKQNQQIYEQAQVLKFYQQFIKTHQQVIKGIQDSGLVDQELFEQNTQRFLQQGDDILKSIPSDTIYIYFYNRINYSKGSYEELRFGFNKGLCAIVGLNEEEAVQFSNQMLILCMMTPESQLRYYMNVLQSEMSGQTCMNVEYQQYTFEGMEITLTTKQQIYHFPGQFSSKDFSLRILEIEPDALTLQQIIQERTKNGIDSKLNDQQNSFKKEEFDRYKAGLKFLEEFYEKKQKKQRIQPQRCDFVMKQFPQTTTCKPRSIESITSSTNCIYSSKVANNNNNKDIKQQEL